MYLLGEHHKMSGLRYMTLSLNCLVLHKTGNQGFFLMVVMTMEFIESILWPGTVLKLDVNDLI